MILRRLNMASPLVRQHLYGRSALMRPLRLGTAVHSRSFQWSPVCRLPVEGSGADGASKTVKYGLLFIKGFLWTLGVSGAALTGYVAILLWRARNPPEQLPRPTDKKKLVILGTGWASVSLLKTLDTSLYDVTVVSPRNYFLFTPLLPSSATGMVEHRSIMEPIRAIIRHKEAEATFVEGEVIKIDTNTRTINVKVKAVGTEDVGLPDMTTEISYDDLVIGVGSEVSTYGIPGVREYGCFMKEIDDAQRARGRIMDCIESASFPGLDEATRKRLLHAVVVGGGPTGVEFAAELHDFFHEDLLKYNPDLANDFRVTLVEALPNVLPSFSKHLIGYTEKTLKDEKITVLTKTAVKDVTETEIIAERTLPNGQKEKIEMPYGLFVWAGGNMMRPIIKELVMNIPAQKGSRRGLLIDEYLAVKGLTNTWAVGDCTSSHYAPTAQVAAQEGAYLGTLLNRRAKVGELDTQVARIESELNAHPSQPDPALEDELRALERKRRRFGTQKTFQYSHQGSLAYIGSEKAVADLSILSGSEFAWGGKMTYLFWRSAYLNMCFSFRNKVLVLFDWVKVKIFGRDISRE